MAMMRRMCVKELLHTGLTSIGISVDAGTIDMVWIVIVNHWISESENICMRVKDSLEIAHETLAPAGYVREVRKCLGNFGRTKNRG